MIVQGEKMKTNRFGIIIFTFVVVVVVALIYTQSNNTEKFLSKYNINEKEVKEIVSILEERTDEPVLFNAGITGSHLIMSDDQTEVKMELPSELFYLSIAPYINQTHPCGIHNLVTCKGELQNQEFNVVVTDKKTNEVIFDDQIKTASNGFLGIWLPKNIEGFITVSNSNLTASTIISTHENDNTCLTTLQLA
jgi:hypothetical protein